MRAIFIRAHRLRSADLIARRNDRSQRGFFAANTELKLLLLVAAVAGFTIATRRRPGIAFDGPNIAVILGAHARTTGDLNLFGSIFVKLITLSGGFGGVPLGMIQENELTSMAAIGNFTALGQVFG